MTKTATIAMSALVGAVLAGAGVWCLKGAGEKPPMLSAVVAADAPALAAIPATPGASRPNIAHPGSNVEQAKTAGRSFEADLVRMLGGQAVATLFRVDDSDRRFVATVDNLGRSAAPAGAWPMNPVDGQFEVTQAGDRDDLRGLLAPGPDRGHPAIRLPTGS